jgi:uncharacterized MAPEG superfamily protein
MSHELTMLAWTAVLGIVQLLIVAQFFTAANGLSYGMSPRDTPPKPLSALGGRFERAFRNLMETFPFAAAAILVAAVAGRSNAYTWWGAQLYFWSRLVYLPLYAAGVPFLRSLVWAVSLLGIVLVLAGLAWG